MGALEVKSKCKDKLDGQTIRAENFNFAGYSHMKFRDKNKSYCTSEREGLYESNLYLAFLKVYRRFFSKIKTFFLF